MTLRFDGSIGDWVDDSLVWDPIRMTMVTPESRDAYAALSPNLQRAMNNRNDGGILDAVSQSEFKQAGLNPNLKIYGGNGQVAAPGATPDGVTADVPFGGYDGGFWGGLSDLMGSAAGAVNSVMSPVADAAGGFLDDTVDPLGDKIGQAIEPVVGNEDLWFTLTSAALGGAAAGGLTSGSTMGSGLSTGAIDSAGGAMMPGAAAAGGTTGGLAGAGSAAAGGTGSTGSGSALGGLNPSAGGGVGLNSNMATGMGLNGAQVGMPVAQTGGAAFNNALSPGLQSALGSAAGTTAANTATSPIFNNIPGANSTGGLNPNITGTPGLNANATGGTGLNTAAGGEAFNSGLSPELQGVLNNPATQTGAVGAGGGILDQIGQVGQGAGQIGDLINQLTNGESGGTPTNQQQQNGQYNLPWQFLLGSILPMMMAGRGNEASWNQAWNDTLNSDPWRAEQGKYMPLLLDAAQHGIGNTDYGRSIASSVARQDSAKGYNMSGNMATDIAGSLNNGTAQYMQALSPLAMGRAPDTRGLANIAQGRAQANDQQWGAIMSGLGSIFSGTPQNNNNFSLSGLYDSLRNSLPSLG